VARQSLKAIATALRPNFALSKRVVQQAYDLIWAPIVYHTNRSALEAGCVEFCANRSFVISCRGLLSLRARTTCRCRCRITSATGQSFTIGKRNADFSRVSAPDAAYYLPVLDMSAGTFPTDVLFWGIDLLNQPDIKWVFITIGCSYWVRESMVSPRASQRNRSKRDRYETSVVFCRVLPQPGDVAVVLSDLTRVSPCVTLLFATHAVRAPCDQRYLLPSARVRSCADFLAHRLAPGVGGRHSI
jgi:hypothetical protein